MEERILKTFHLPTYTDYVIVHWKTVDKKVRKIFMAPITYEDELILDDGKPIFIEINERNVRLTNKSVICYGCVDFDTDSSDMAFVRNLRWCEGDGFRGTAMPSRYNYKNHTAVGDAHGMFWFDTCKSDDILRYKHGCLGKPERIVVWKEYGK